MSPVDASSPYDASVVKINAPSKLNAPRFASVSPRPHVIIISCAHAQNKNMMTKRQRVPVTLRALLQRLNRALKPNNETLKTTRGERLRQQSWQILRASTFSRNYNPAARTSSPEKMARDMGALKAVGSGGGVVKEAFIPMEPHRATLEVIEQAHTIIDEYPAQDR